MLPSKKEIIQSAKIIVLALAFSVGISYVFAWTGPASNAPLGNVSAPINTGSIAQTKLGQLLLAPATLPAGQAAFDVSGIASVNGLLVNGVVAIAGGNPGTGKVLTSDADGFASWQSPTGGSGGGATVLGPLSYATQDFGNNSQNYVTSTFVLAQASEVVIQSSVNLCGAIIFNIFMHVDGIEKDKKAFRGESNGADCGTVVLSSRVSLVAGSHTVKIQGGLFTSYAAANYGYTTRPVDTYVYVLNGGGFSAGSGGGTWENVPLTGSSDFDRSCEYRFNLAAGSGGTAYGTNHFFYASGVSSEQLIYISHSSNVSHIPKTNKNQYRVNGSPVYDVTGIEKRCGGVGGGGSTADACSWKSTGAGKTGAQLVADGSTGICRTTSGSSTLLGNVETRGGQTNAVCYQAGDTNTLSTGSFEYYSCAAASGGGTSTGTMGSGMLGEVPDAILCQSGAKKVVMYAEGVNVVSWPTPGRLVYSSESDSGGIHLTMYFNPETGAVITPSAGLNAGESYYDAIRSCEAKGNLSNQTGFKFAGVNNVTATTVITCPSGMSRVNSSTGNQYCIDTAERTPPPSAQIASVCAVEGKYLCLASDLVRACQINGTPVMTGLANNKEISGDYSPDLDQAILVGNACTAVAPDNYSAGGGYRCCLR
ncbi:MAG: hypothetical protein AAB511_01620 [Patescibacteria group bacterium]